MRIEALKERQQAAELQADLAAIKRDQRQLLRYVSRLERERAVMLAATRSRIKPPSPAKRTRGNEATALFLVSDWHVGDVVKPEAVSGLNRFDLTIAAQRGKECFRRFLMLLEHERELTRIDSVQVGLLGDFISGNIHEEVREESLLSPYDACDWTSEHLAPGLEAIAKHVKDVLIVTAVGNHGRTTKEMRHASRTSHNFEMGIYRTLPLMLKHVKNIRWQIGEGAYNYTELYGKTLRWHHGDLIKGGGGNPVAGAQKSLYRLNQNKWAHLDLFGHFHQFCHSRAAICNGSIKGYDGYAESLGCPWEPPAQAMAVVDKERWLTRVLPVFVD